MYHLSITAVIDLDLIIDAEDEETAKGMIDEEITLELGRECDLYTLHNIRKIK